VDKTGAQHAEVLVLRAWVERPHEHGLRVRLLRITGSSEPTSMTTATVDAACAIVRCWLEQLLGAAAVDPERPPPPS
jgi:hypothetical protein